MRTAHVLPALVAAMLLPSIVAAAGGGSMSSSGPEVRQLSPAEQAKAAYNDGVRTLKQAAKAEEAAAEATKDDKKAKSLERAKKQYEKARQQFVAAVQGQPKMHEAWNYIGYTSRKLGEYDQALMAYEEALKLAPTYAPAIEYRGEAYLGLNRIDDAKAAYMALFNSSREHASQLMTAMQQWVAARRTDPAGLSATELDTFAQWITERSGIAQQTASLATDAAPLLWK